MVFVKTEAIDFGMSICKVIIMGYNRGPIIEG